MVGWYVGMLLQNHPKSYNIYVNLSIYIYIYIDDLFIHKYNKDSSHLCFSKIIIHK